MKHEALCKLEGVAEFTHACKNGSPKKLLFYSDKKMVNLGGVRVLFGTHLNEIYVAIICTRPVIDYVMNFDQVKSKDRKFTYHGGIAARFELVKSKLLKEFSEYLSSHKMLKNICFSSHGYGCVLSRYFIKTISGMHPDHNLSFFQFGAMPAGCYTEAIIFDTFFSKRNIDVWNVQHIFDPFPFCATMAWGPTPFISGREITVGKGVPKLSKRVSDEGNLTIFMRSKWRNFHSMKSYRDACYER